MVPPRASHSCRRPRSAVTALARTGEASHACGAHRTLKGTVGLRGASRMGSGLQKQL